MKETILNQLNEYSRVVSTLEQEIQEYEKVLAEKRRSAEQHKGAYSAMFNLALSQNYIDESGNIIEDTTETVEAEEVKEIEIESK